MSLSSVLFPEPFRPTSTILLLIVRSSVTPSSNAATFCPAVAFVDRPPIVVHTCPFLDPAIFADPFILTNVVVFRSIDTTLEAKEDEEEEDGGEGHSPLLAPAAAGAAVAGAAAGGNEKDMSLHWMSGASVPHARGVMSGNLKTVSLSICAAKLCADGTSCYA